MKKLKLICLVPFVIGFVLSASPFNTPSKHFQLIVRLVEHVRIIAKGSLDVVLVDDPFSGDVIRRIFHQLRRFLSGESVVKIEVLNDETPTRKRLLYVVDGSTLKMLVMFIYRLNQLRSTLENNVHRYFLFLSTTHLSPSNKLLFKIPLSCHMIFIHITNDDLTIHRISPANFNHIRSFNANAPVEWIFEDKPDWHGYRVNIFAAERKYPHCAVVNNALVGVDVEASKAIFDSANMSYNFVILPNSNSFDQKRFSKTLDDLLVNGSIHVVLARVGYSSPYGQCTTIRDTDGACLLIPRNHRRNYIYHLVHPFELNTWMVVVVILLLDIVLGVYFPNAFPHNLIMILLFGDSLADHEQTRWTRFYCFACTVFLFLLSEAYLAKAIIYMTMTRYAPDMKTVAEFIASDIPILIEADIRQQLNKSQMMSQLLSKTVEDPNFYFHMDSSVYAYFVSCGFGRQLVDRQVTENYMKHGREGKRRFYLVDEWVMWYFNSLVVQYRFMYYARFEEMLGWLGEAGLWDKWINDLQETEERYSQYELRDEDEILFLEDLAAVWYLVLVGWTVSGMTFLLELAWNCLKRNYRGLPRYIGY